MFTQRNQIILNEKQAESHFGSDWVSVIEFSSGLLFDGFEVTAEIDSIGNLVLTSVNGANFEEIYG